MRLTSSASGATALQTDEFTAPAAASINAFVLALASATTPTTLSGAGLTGATGSGSLAVARNVTVTTAGVAAALTDGSGVVITGKDPQGNAQTETISLTVAGSPGTFVGAKLFSSVTSVVIPAQALLTATIAVGFGALLGLSAKIKSRAGRLAILQEVANAALVTSGTFSNTAGTPVASYAPASAPNGSLNFSITYERA